MEVLQQADEVERAADVGADGAQRLGHVPRRRGRRRQVVDLVEALVGAEMLDVAVDKMQPRIVHVGDVVVQAGPQVVDDAQLFDIAAGEQPIHHVRADEAATASHQDVSHQHLERCLPHKFVGARFVMVRNLVDFVESSHPEDGA